MMMTKPKGMSLKLWNKTWPSDGFNFQPADFGGKEDPALRTSVPGLIQRRRASRLDGRASVGAQVRRTSPTRKRRINARAPLRALSPVGLFVAIASSSAARARRAASISPMPSHRETI